MASWFPPAMRATVSRQVRQGTRVQVNAWSRRGPIDFEMLQPGLIFGDGLI